MEEIVICLLMVQEKFNAKDSENVTKNGFNGYVYDFSVDYNAIAVDEILDIHKYFMKKNNIVHV